MFQNWGGLGIFSSAPLNDSEAVRWHSVFPFDESRILRRFLLIILALYAMDESKDPTVKSCSDEMEAFSLGTIHDGRAATLYDSFRLVSDLSPSIPSSSR